jgi:hypothetical protein
MKTKLMPKLVAKALIFLAICLTPIAAWAQTIWNGTADTTWYTNNKSATEYTITTAEQLAGLARLADGGTTNGRYNMKGKTITLGNDIALNDTTDWQNWDENTTGLKQWIPIGGGTSNNSFDGTFDGNGHVVSGVYINDNSYYNYGLFGNSAGTIKNLGVKASYINCTKTFSSRYVGGLVGLNRQGSITNSYATGNVSGKGDVGGLVGANSYGNITNSYAMGNVSGNSDVGGLVGYNGGGNITNSYAIGNVSGNENIGGLEGYNNAGGSIKNSYYDSQTSGQNDNERGMPRTTAEMQSADFVFLLNVSAYALSANAWIYSAGKYPTLGNAPLDTEPSISSYFGDGSGIEDSPYIITTKEQLEWFSLLVYASWDFNNEYLKLGANIMLNDTTNWQNWNENTTGLKQWIPIGPSQTNSFRGTFDGNGHVISGVYISSTNDYQGLFGYIPGGNIKNLGLKASYIKGNSSVGGLVGFQGRITNSYSMANVSGNRNVGGLVGNGGSITNSYATGNVSGTENVGGLVGNSGSITNSYATGNVSGTENVGGLVGSKSAYVSNSYYDNQTSGQKDNDGKGEPKTTAQMKQQATFVNWDFVNIWKIEEGVAYPYLEIRTNISNCTIDNIPTQTSSSAPITPAVSVSCNGATLTANTDYTVAYSNNIDAGWATVSITGIGNYSGTVQRSFRINSNTPILSPQLASAKIHAYATGSNIILENLPQNAKVELYNLQGKHIYSGNSGNSQILRILVQTKGMYIVKTTSGNEKKTLRVVVK